MQPAWPAFLLNRSQVNSAPSAPHGSWPGADDFQGAFLEGCAMPSHPKFSPHQFRVSSGLQVPDLPFVRDCSFSLSPTPLGLARSFHCLSPAILVRPRTLEPSIHPSTFSLSFPLPWSFLSLYHGQLLQSLPWVPPCPFALHFISFCPTTALVESSSPPRTHAAYWQVSPALGPS